VSELKFKVGGRVMVNSPHASGEAKILQVDYGTWLAYPYQVSLGEIWVRQDDLILIREAPPPLKYKAGDWVLMEVRVIAVDANDAKFSYKIDVDGEWHWVPAGQIITLSRPRSPWSGTTLNPWHGEDPAQVAARQASVAAEFARGVQFRKPGEG